MALHPATVSEGRWHSLRRMTVIKCFECPLQDLCSATKIVSGPPIKVEWLPDESKDICPLYKAAEEMIKQNG